MISLPGVPPVPGVHDAAPLKEATAAQEQQRTAHQQQQAIAQQPQPNQPVHKVKAAPEYPVLSNNIFWQTKILFIVLVNCVTWY